MNVADYGKAMTKMYHAYGWDYLYRQLAEECAELGHASLKLIWAIHKETPMPYEEAADKYIEELADTWLMIAIARTDMTDAEKAAFDRTVAHKYDRLMERIGGTEGNTPPPLKM